MLLQYEWQALWNELGAEPPADLGRELTARYQEPHRKYHTLQHLTECLEHFEPLREYAERPAEVKVAIWFHDAIYDTRRSDNERQSAEWARDAMLACRLSTDSARRVYELVQATEHNAVPVGRDAQVLVDVDLWILGAPAARFDEYEAQVRKEYSWVAEPVYRAERNKVLRHFAARPRIFATPLFFERYESRARANIERSLQKL